MGAALKGQLELSVFDFNTLNWCKSSFSVPLAPDDHPIILAPSGGVVTSYRYGVKQFVQAHISVANQHQFLAEEGHKIAKRS